MQLARRTFLKAGGLAALALSMPGRASAIPVIGGNAFGSYWRLVPGEPARPEELSAAISAIVEAVDATMSPYRDTSELVGLNAYDGSDWITVSPGMGSVLEAALEAAQQSSGAFDPTVGPVVGRYGFGPIHGRRTGDAGDLELANGALRKGKAGLTVDLCGIAKGWALDLMGEALNRIGLASYLLELGGEVLTRGQHPEGRPWRIAIEGTHQALEPGGLAVATSGLAAQSFRVGGRQYGHIIDPSRNAPAIGDLISISVLAPRAMFADAWATALFSRGYRVARDLAEARGIDAVFVLRDGNRNKVLVTGARASARLL